MLRKLRRIGYILNIAGLTVLVVARILSLAAYLRIRLSYMKWRNKRRFLKALRRGGVPGNLAESLAETYEARLEKHTSLPGILSLAAHEWSKHTPLRSLRGNGSHRK